MTGKEKRKAEIGEAVPTKKAAPSKEPPSIPDAGGSRPKLAVNPKRVRPLNKATIGQGPVIYWLSRDQRIDDNWALLYALEQATARNVPVAIVFNLVGFQDMHAIVSARACSTCMAEFCALAWMHALGVDDASKYGS